MTTHITGRNFSRIIQQACQQRLPRWKRLGTACLYRRTDDFVQFLSLESSAYEVRRVPAVTTQTLALQLAYIGSNTTYRIRHPDGGEYWFSPSEWCTSSDSILDTIIAQIEPSASESLTNQALAHALKRWRTYDEPYTIATFGVLAVVEGQEARGRAILEQAMRRFQALDVQWATVFAQKLQSWLAEPPAMLVARLRDDAATGRQLLQLE